MNALQGPGHSGEPTSPRLLAVFVAGTPAPQGSKRAIVHKHSGKAVTMESSKAVKPWRADVRAALLDGTGNPLVVIGGGVRADLEFVLHRPKYLARKPTPPHTKKPDIDKLQRSTLDAITSAGCWSDDSVVVDIRARKRYAEVDEPTGAHIHIQPARTGPVYEEPMRA